MAIVSNFILNGINRLSESHLKVCPVSGRMHLGSRETVLLLQNNQWLIIGGEETSLACQHDVCYLDMGIFTVF